MLARKLMKYQNLGAEKEDAIIKFLCSESGSHDYSITKERSKRKFRIKYRKAFKGFIFHN